MEMHCLKALYKLAKDILEGGPGSQIRLDTTLFNGDDCDRISFTLKNYKRPNGVATQIFNVDLIGYQPSLLSQKFVVATAGSTNHRPSVIMVNDEFEARPLKLADIVKASEERRHSKKDKLQKHDPPKKESVKNYNSAPSN